MQSINCLVCNAEASARDYGGGADTICTRCGSFKISGLASQEMTAWSRRQRANLSGWIREHQGCSITIPDLKTLVNLGTPTVGEKAQKLLERFAAMGPKPGSAVNITRRADSRPNVLKAALMGFEDNWHDLVDPQFLAWSWSEDLGELAYLIKEYLVAETGAIAITNDWEIRITPKGWAQLDAQRLKQTQSQIGFIAMWFSEAMTPAWKAIERGIEAAGYKSLRIDQTQHNNKINDEIIAAIRRSKFVVADFTGQRGGVYFEAGFGLGLGLQVIWLCRHDDLKQVHFDNRQYNFILWTDDKLTELEHALKNRIEATIGPGPLNPIDQP